MLNVSTVRNNPKQFEITLASWAWAKLRRKDLDAEGKFCAQPRFLIWKMLNHITEWRMGMKMSISMCLCILSVVFLGGNASAAPRVSADFLKANNYKKVAIIFAGDITVVRQGCNVTGTKTALEHATETVSKIMADKGYEVIFAQPVLVGPYNELADKAKDTSNKEPAFQYAIDQATPEFYNAVRSAYSKYYSKYDSYRPKDSNQNPFSAGDVQTLSAFTGADLIGFYRILGTKYSAGATALSYTLYASSNDLSRGCIYFVDAKTGDVVFAQAEDVFTNPYNPKAHDDIAKSMLSRFPSAGYPYGAK